MVVLVLRRALFAIPVAGGKIQTWLGHASQQISSTMVTYDEGGAASSPVQPSLPSRVFSTRHKTIGLQYLWLSLSSVFVGVVLSTFLRIHASWPSVAIPFLNAFQSTPEQFAAV